MRIEIDYSPPGREPSALQVAALASAIDAEGRIDVVGYEAQRLILQSQGLTGPRPDLLAQQMQQSPLFHGDPRNREMLENAIRERLDDPVRQQQFDEALHPGMMDQVGAAAKHGWRQVTAALGDVDQQVTHSLSAAHRWAQGVAGNPHVSPAERLAAQMAAQVVGGGQFAYGAGSGAVQGVAELARSVQRFATDAPTRDFVVAQARDYLQQTAHDPAKPLNDARRAATAAFEQWDKGYQQAAQEGRSAQYLGGLAGAAGVELAMLALPTAQISKLGRAAKVVEELGPAGNTAKAGEALVELAQGLRAGGAAGQTAELELRMVASMARSSGKLDELVTVARRTGTMDGLLLSGELPVRDLSALLKTDKTLFEGKVGFEEALQRSTHGKSVAQMSSREVGDIGEALYTKHLVDQGYTEIYSIRNQSGHGIDSVARNPQGQLEFAEIKTSARGHVRAQNVEPGEFIASRLARAVGEDPNKFWRDHLVSPETRELAGKIRQEVLGAAGKLHPDQPKKWVDIQLSNPQGSHRIQHHMDVQEWTGPKAKHTQHHALTEMPETAVAQAARYPTDPGHPLHNSYRQIRESIAASGRWTDERMMDNLAAGALKQLVNDEGVDRIVEVRTIESGVAVICKSDLWQRIERTETHLCYAGVAKSGQVPAEQHFQQIAQAMQQEQNQQQVVAQQSSSPVMKM